MRVRFKDVILFNLFTAVSLLAKLEHGHLQTNQESLAFLGAALNQISWCDVNSEQRFIKTGKKTIDAEDSCPLE